MDKHAFSRRHFLKQSILSAGAIATGLPSVFNSPIVQAAGFDYQALVYIFLSGGNDSFNMVAPKGLGSLRTRYETGRRDIAIAADSLVALNSVTPPKIYGNETYTEFGMHPECVDMANLYNNQELAVICNLGNLVAPTTKESYINQSVTLPSQLFSHIAQQHQFQSDPMLNGAYGWGGRMAELLQAENTDAMLSPLISTAGKSQFQRSQLGHLSTHTLSPKGPETLNQYSGKRMDMLDQVMTEDLAHPMAEYYQKEFLKIQQANQLIIDAYQAGSGNGVDYEGLFNATGANSTNIGQQLKTVAKMIAGRHVSANNRPIFFVEMEGFDTSQYQLKEHATLMKELNAALKSFREALVLQGDFDKTLSFIGSEFGRTFTPNSNGGSAGTDNGWGGHALVMGGMVNGGRFYGTHPNLILGNSQDTDTNDARGRWIPTTSTSQCSAVIAKWFGIPRSTLTDIFPSLSNFPNTFELSANLNFIDEGITA